MPIRIFRSLLPTKIPLKLFSKAVLVFPSLAARRCSCIPSALSFGQAVVTQEMSVSNCFLILGFELDTLSADVLLHLFFPWEGQPLGPGFIRTETS